mgnify:CR=1 FL=1
MRKILLFIISLGLLTTTFTQNRADFYWSGNGASDVIDQGANWWGGSNPSSGDNLYFNNTGNRHWAYSNYAGGSYFGNIITYNGAGGIKWYGDNTYAYKIENNNDGNLFELSPNSASSGNREIGNRIDNDLEINPVGTGGILVSCDKISIDNSNAARSLKVYGGNTLTINGFIYEKNGTGASFQLMQSATVIIKGNSTYTGTTTLNAGTLELQGSIANSAVTVKSGATLKINGDGITVASLTVESGGVVNIEEGKSLTVTGALSNSGTLTIKSGLSGTGSLITDGTVSGNVTVQRYLDEASKAAKWHYVSSPVSGQLLNDAWMTTNSILTGTGGKYQLFRYDEDQNYWIIYGSTGDPEAFTDGNFVEARGYSVARDGADVIEFKGSVRTDDVTYAATYTANKGKGWNLVGNPFTSAIGVTSSASSTGKFLSDNSGVIDASYLALYIWDEQSGYVFGENDYKIISNGAIGDYTRISQDYIESGQAFMVKVKPTAGNLAFNKNMQYHANVDFYKSKETWPSVELVVEGNGTSNSTSVGFHEDMTAGLDPSYDVGKLKGNPDIALYTRLVEDNGVDFAIQALPFDNLETFEIPVGISISTPGVYEFSASTTNFENFNIVLEDQQTNVFTNLRWDKYSAEINQNGIGRFYLHFKDATAIQNHTPEREPLTFYTPNTLNIRNLQPGNYQITVSDIAGRSVAAKQVSTDGSVEMPLSLQTGVYIVEVSSESARFANKIIIK